MTGVSQLQTSPQVARQALAQCQAESNARGGLGCVLDGF